MGKVPKLHLDVEFTEKTSKWRRWGLLLNYAPPAAWRRRKDSLIRRKVINRPIKVETTKETLQRIVERGNPFREKWTAYFTDFSDRCTICLLSEEDAVLVRLLE